MTEGNKKELLIVEDEGYVFERVKEIVSGFGEFEISFVDNGDSAREIIGNKVFDVVIADIYTYGISGLEVLYKAKLKNKDVCVVIITGIDNVDLAEKALKEGAFDYIIKPPALEKLKSILKLLKIIKP